MPPPDKLLVYWKETGTLPKADEIILSFLSPAKEEGLRKKFGGKIISAREIARQVKDEARKIYVALVSRIGATPIGGETLRQRLKDKTGTSLWWYHSVSHKDCESDLTFQFIIEILVIFSVATSIEPKKIVLFGGYKEVYRSLKSVFQIQEIECESKYNPRLIFMRAIASRIKYFILFFLRWIIIKQSLKAPCGLPDVVFSGFWDWSVKEDHKTKKICDRYSKSLADRLISKGLKVGWFLWFDPYGMPGTGGRKIKDVLGPVARHDNLVILQGFIKFRDLVGHIADFRPYLIFRNFFRKREFKRIFIEKGIDFLPLFSGNLTYGFLSSGIPHLELVSLASSRAFSKYKPLASVSFLELFLHSRAFYVGAKQGYPEAVNYAIQHASYSREKTFVLLDPEMEYGGKPDNLPIPKPDYIFAMGELGKEIFMESGFPQERIFLTGSPRYEHLSNSHLHKESNPKKVKNLLIVPALDINLEILMVEAVSAAAQGLPDLKLSLRNHPFARLDRHPDFAIYRNRITVSEASLEEDLQEADLIIFSYSTVAEEALIRGIPVWQWLPVSYNGSVFRDLKAIPSFYSISNLREALREFISNSEDFMLDDKTRDLVIRKCFYAIDGKVNYRIADCIFNQVSDERRS